MDTYWLSVSVLVLLTGTLSFISYRHYRLLTNQIEPQRKIAEALIGSNNVAEVAQKLLSALMQGTSWELGSVFLLSDNSILVPACTYTKNAADYIEFSRLTEKLHYLSGVGLPGDVFSSGKAVWYADLKKVPFPRQDGAIRAGLQSALIFPIRSGSEVVGVCELYSPVKGYKPPLALEFYDNVGMQIGLLTERQNVYDQLTRSEAELRAVIDAAADGIVWIDDEGKIEWVNKAALKLLGYEEDELIGNYVERFIPDTYSEKLGSALKYYFRCAMHSVLDRATEVIGQRKDGHTFPIELVVSPVTFADRRVFIAVLRDVSDRKVMERRVSEFYSTISHELRSPLASIRGSLGLIHGGASGEIPEEVKELVQIAKKNCDRLIRLINDILDAKKVEAGKLIVKKQMLDSNELISSSVEGIRPFADESGVEIDWKPGEKSLVIGDPDRIVQVLTNLLSNAIKYSSSGGKIEVRTDAAINGSSFVRFSVADHGPGIESEHLEKLFSEFHQIDSSDSRPKGGTGLGLAISKRLVELLDGHIGVDNTPGCGATFWFELRIAEGTAETIERNGRPESLKSEDRAAANIIGPQGNS